MHAVHHAETYDRGARALAELRAAGRIGGFGAGNQRARHDPALPRPDRIGTSSLSRCLTHCSISRCWTANFPPRCAEKGVGLRPSARCSPPASSQTGAVQRCPLRPTRRQTPAMLAKVARIEAVCARHGVPIAAAALQFPLGHPSVASVDFPGGLSPEHVRQNVAAFRHPIPAGALGRAETR